MSVYSPNLLRAKDGGILLMFMRQHRAGSLTNHVWKSTDEGRERQPDESGRSFRQRNQPLSGRLDVFRH